MCGIQTMGCVCYSHYKGCLVDLNNGYVLFSNGECGRLLDRLTKLKSKYQTEFSLIFRLFIAIKIVHLVVTLSRVSEGSEVTFPGKRGIFTHFPLSG